MESSNIVLIVGQSPQSGKELSDILGMANFTVVRTPTCLEALVELAANPDSVVICDGALPDGSWKDLLQHAGPRSSTRLIVTERLADNSLWAEVLNLGGYDVLAQPFDCEEVTRVVGSAVRARGSMTLPAWA